MNKLKNILKSKTMVVALLLGVGGVVEQNLQIVSQYVSPQQFGLITTGFGILMAVLRWYTTLPLEDK